MDTVRRASEFAQSSDLNLKCRRQLATTSWSSIKPKGASGIVIAHAMAAQRTRSWSKALGTRGGGTATGSTGNSADGNRTGATNVERESVAATRHGCERGEGFEG